MAREPPVASATRLPGSGIRGMGRPSGFGRKGEKKRMNRREILGLLALLPAAALAQEPDITHAQPELPREKLVIVTRDGKEYAFNVEVAKTPEQETVGLMFRTSVPPDGGMLCDWKQPRESQMWMRNTLVPLDM